MMNLQQLRYAVALADAQSFTKAAVNEYVVQSALSQQLRKLEDELGVTLFERTTRMVAPTPAGEALLPLMRQVLAGVDQIKFGAQSTQRHHRGSAHRRNDGGALGKPRRRGV